MQNLARQLRTRLWAGFLSSWGFTLFFLQFRPALDGWFSREDSRFFSNGYFSPWDLIAAFATPQNHMGHYRPITKLFWAVPRWLGFFDPAVYHGISIFMLALAGLLLARLAFLLFGNLPLAVFAACFWVLMPVHSQNVYWYCAIQNLAVSVFVLAMTCFRLEQWQKPHRESTYRALCLLCAAGAIFSRELGFAYALLLFAIDAHYGKLRRSWDLALLLVPMILFVFVLHPPFQQARAQIDAGYLLRGGFLSELWEFSLSTPWTLGHARSVTYPPWATALSALLLGSAIAAPFLSRRLLFSALFAAAGIAPFLLIQFRSVDYAFLFGAGLALILSGYLALAFEKLSWTRLRDPTLCVCGAFLLLGYYLYLQPNREVFREMFVHRPAIMRGFIQELSDFAHAQEPYRPIVLKSLGPYLASPAADNHHFIPLGLDEFLEDRIVLIEPSALGTGEGTNMRDPNIWIWKHPYSGSSPKPFRYTERGFTFD